MKFGLLVNRNLLNLGDDVQSYAEALFLPKIDYLVNREYIDEFKPDTEEPVACIMGAWWMRHKWNFPPSKYIYPLWISFHLTNYTVRKTGSSIQDELLSGVGGEYMNAYGPVGTRDLATLKVLKNRKIKAYFSGCVTLTLPKQRIITPKKEYICIVDVDPRVQKKLSEKLKDSDIEIRYMSAKREKRRTSAQMDNWDYRKSEIEEMLTIYQNAKCVITRRLHVALPCLAMEVPVLCVHHKTNIRFSPYNDWLHMVSPDEFVKGEYDYDFLNPKPNKTLHLETAEQIRSSITAWVEETKRNTQSLNESIATTYTEDDLLRWQHSLMKDALNNWLPESIKMCKRIDTLTAQNKKLKKKVDALQNGNGDASNIKVKKSKRKKHFGKLHKFIRNVLSR